MDEKITEQDMNLNDVLIQAKGMAHFVKNFIAVMANFEKHYIGNESLDFVQEMLEAFLYEEYKNQSFGHATSTFLEVTEWQKFKEVLNAENIPNNLLPKNVYFQLSDSRVGDVKVFNTLKGRVQLIGSFNISDEGKVVYVTSYQGDNMPPLTSIVNYAWMIGRQSERDDVYKILEKK